MRTREWERIERRATVEAFGKWLASLKDSVTWNRGDVCSCPLHAFIEWATGHSLCINSPELSEHWGERSEQSWPTPWWMTWLMRSVDHTGGQYPKPKGKIGLAELRAIFRIGVERGWSNPLMRPEDLETANIALSGAESKP